jgi:hypothetical protein
VQAREAAWRRYETPQQKDEAMSKRASGFQHEDHERLERIERHLHELLRDGGHIHRLEHRIIDLERRILDAIAAQPPAESATKLTVDLGDPAEKPDTTDTV